MLKNLKLSHISAGFIAVLVGYSGSVAIIFQAIEAVGATQAQANSWMLVLGFGMGISGMILSFYYKMPILTAWSTPGAAMLVIALNGVPLAQAVGAFLFCGVLLFVTGITEWFGRLARWVPDSIANAMLGGILFKFGLQVFVELKNETALILVMCAAYLIGKRFWPRLAILTVLIAGVVFAVIMGQFGSLSQIDFTLARPEFVMPAFSLPVLVGVGIPLYVVTMTAQNISGIFVMRSNGYEPPASGAIAVTGLTSIILAPFGGFAFNLAAITAAICAAPEADENQDTRYLAVMMAGVFNCLFGLMGASIIGLFLIAPHALIAGLAGLALLGTIGNSLRAAFADDAGREAALVTFLITVSGISFYGVSAPVWALLGGGAVLLLQKR